MLASRGHVLSLLRRATHHPVTRALAGFTVATSVVKVAAFIKEAVVAAAFGVGFSMDSYLMALVIIGFPSGVLMNAVHTVFTREYVRTIAVHGESAAAGFLRLAFFAVVGALTALLAAWVVLLPAVLSLIGHGLPPPQRGLVAANVLRLIPYYYLTGINLLGYAVLQSRRVFLRSALIPIATPLAVMAAIALWRADLNVLIGALTLGTGAETVLVVILVRKHWEGSFGRVPQARRGLRDLAWGTLVLMPGTVITGLSPVIEQTIASGLGHGTISALGYAAKLPATMNSLLTTAIAVTILPYFSQRLSLGDERSCRAFFIRYTTVLTVAGVLIAAAAVFCSEPFVRLAFQRGQFSAQNSLLVTVVQQAYLWQLPGAMVNAVALRYVAAQGRYRAMTIASTSMVPIAGLLQWALAESWGAPGLAFGSSAGISLTAVVFLWLALRRSPGPVRSLATP